MEIQAVAAKLTKTLTYHNGTEERVLPEGTQIVVDEDNLIALYGADHFDIDSNEFKVLIF